MGLGIKIFRFLTLVAMIITGSIGATTVHALDKFTYFEPGNILPPSVRGVYGREVTFPEWTFPLEVGKDKNLHAYIGTQLSKYHGVSWANDPRLFKYPHRDNQCEPRKWKVLACPAGKGHQGVDIRGHDNSDSKWKVIAVESGVVTMVTPNTTVAVRSGNRTARYLHMSPGSIKAAGIKQGMTVNKGQVLGKISNFMGGKPNTSRHLHFDVYTGTAKGGKFYHIYPSLIAAYRRSWDLPEGVKDGMLTFDKKRELGSGSPPPDQPDSPDRPVMTGAGCDGVELGEILRDIEPEKFSGLWLHNCSIMGLIAPSDSNLRAFSYYKPKKSLMTLVENMPIYFLGTFTDGEFSGLAKSYSQKCGPLSFEVSGKIPTTEEPSSIILEGKRNKRSAENCQVIGQVSEKLQFDFLEKYQLKDNVVNDPNVPQDRITLSELTRNFLAITFYPNDAGQIKLLPYFAKFPALASGGMKDSGGGLIPSLLSDEAGVAISWVWINKRARYTNGLSVTPRLVAYSMAGVDPAACNEEVEPNSDDEASRSGCESVARYLSGYVGFASGRNFAQEYFGRKIGVDEIIDLSDREKAWNWMRTMYSHESGRIAVVPRDAFERGLAFGDDYIRYFYIGDQDNLRSNNYYTDPCNFGQPTCKGEPEKLLTEEGFQELVNVLNRLENQLVVMEKRNKNLTAIIQKLTSKNNSKNKSSNRRKPLY